MRGAARREAALLRQLRCATSGTRADPPSSTSPARGARKPPWRLDAPRRARAPERRPCSSSSSCRIAVAIGVLVGKGNGNNDQGLADAIKGLHAGGGSGGQLASTAATTPTTSDFTLDKGYTVELKTLPADGTDQAAVDSAKQGATSQGAADVGIINTSEFTVTPAPPANTYVLYSGRFKSKAEATKALGKLKGKFKDAKGVVSVKKNASREGQLVNNTAYGVTSTRSRASRRVPRKTASDTAIVNQEGQKTGKNYIDSQKNLPDVIVVRRLGRRSSNPAGQGNGD